MDHEFYVNWDNGLPAWHCYDCDVFICYIEPGDWLASHVLAAELHTCDVEN